MEPFKANWRNDDEYPPRGCEDHNRLAWEFIRRHADYALHTQQMLRLADAGEYERIPRDSNSCLDGVECWPEAKPGEVAKAYFARMEKKRIAREKKGGKAIRAPRIDSPCNSFMNKWRMAYPVAPETAYSEDVIRFVKHEIRLKRHTVLKTKNFVLFLYPNEAAVRFRLDIPVAEQIAMARDELTKAVEAYATERRVARANTTRALAAHARSELPTDTLRNAHYWLRCYDAEREPKKLTGDAEARRKLASGPAKRREQFIEECRAVNCTDTFEPGKIKGFLKLARDFIDDRKFLLLMVNGPKRKARTTASL
ncbi:hypothetical protein D9M72_105100 [compost metagenome]